MKLHNVSIGKRGENIATDYFLSRGYKLITRNYRAKRYGEVDIIVQKDTRLIFVEVKTRVGDQFGIPQDAVGKSKIRELKKMVSYYYNQNPSVKESPQIDVVAIVLNPNLTVQSLEHFENITL